MNQNKWWNDFQSLTKKVCQEPCNEELGLDLIRGEFFRSQSVLNAFHLQVCGEDIFMRNTMQRALEADVVQRSDGASIIVIVPNNREEILDEVNKVFEKPTSRGVNNLLFYKQAKSKRSVRLEDAMNLFEVKTQTHLFVELEAKFQPLDHPLLLHLNKKIKEKFRSEILIHFMPDRPFIYLFCPEDMGSQDHVMEFIRGIKEHVNFRIFSTETSSFFDGEDTSRIYGPGLYSKEMCEKMRKHFYWRHKQKRKWNRDKSFFGDRENSKILRWVKTAVGGIDVMETAFGRFLTPYELGYNYFWFYPIWKNFGGLPYSLPSISKAADSKALSQVQDPLLEIMEDLKPKNYEIT